MSDAVITIEPISDRLVDAYAASGMNRGGTGRPALEWTFGAKRDAFAVARQDGRIVGLSAYIHSRMTFGTGAGVGVQAVDSFVSEDMRGAGIFTKLARAYNEHATVHSVDLAWGFPNDNAAPAWFGKLGWTSHGQVPFLIKPLRAGFLLRRLRLPGNFPMAFATDQRIPATTAIGDWADGMWDRFSAGIRCGTIRDRAFLEHRLLRSPEESPYHIVADDDSAAASIVATREATKHGGRIAYLMEAMGTSRAKELLMSELGRLRDRDVEVVLAWAFPWSPNYRLLRSAGFLPLPERFRPIRIWFGARPLSAVAQDAARRESWYLSYLDSDTV